MSNAIYLRWGKLIFAIAITAIGAIHFVTHDFPVGLMPVPATVPGRIVLVYLTGTALILAGLSMAFEKHTQRGAYVAMGVWLLLLLLVHLPRLLVHLHSGSIWTGTFEVAGFLSGTLLIAGLVPGHTKLILTGRWLFLSALVVFTVLHYVYLQYIATLLPGWLPGHLFWCWLVLAAFFAASLSILIQRQVRLAALLLGLMFLLWVVMLHLPLVIANSHTEPQWTSMFVALAMGGVSFTLAGLAKE